MVDHMLRRAMPGRCAFCLAPAEAPWCEACLLALPWNTPACERCAEPLPATLAAAPRLCGACLRRPPAFCRARVPLRYQSPIAGLVQRFKFSASPRAGTILVALMERALTGLGVNGVVDTPRQLLTKDLAEGFPEGLIDGFPGGVHEALPEALIAVPLHERRARERGFDQADWLARRLGQRLGLPCITARRVRMTPSQRGLARGPRRTNLRRAFVIEAALPARVAILDDVMTTGATLEALAEACLAAGAREVEAWAAARTPKH